MIYKDLNVDVWIAFLGKDKYIVFTDNYFHKIAKKLPYQTNLDYIENEQSLAFGTLITYKNVLLKKLYEIKENNKELKIAYLGILLKYCMKNFLKKEYGKNKQVLSRILKKLLKVCKNGVKPIFFWLALLPAQDFHL